MSAELERQVLNAVVMYTKRNQWKAWGLHKLRKQGAAVLLEGPPGCGKTVIAEYIALRVRRKGLKEVAFADFGSNVPGENARNIRKIFEEAANNGDMTIYINEADAVLWDRRKAGADAMWMLEVINELLVQIEKYIGLVFLSTNLIEFLDPALERRLIARVHVPFPAYPERKRLWTQKLPDELPYKLDEKQLEKLATLQLSGAEIETAIINAASDIIRRGAKPKFSDFHSAAEIFHMRRAGEEAPRLK